MAEKKTASKKPELKIDTAEMAQAGLHFGHKTSKIHPKMKPYLFGARNGVHLIDLEKSAEKLKEALKFIQWWISEGKELVFIGTKIQLKGAVKETAEECGLPHVAERWLGGTFTNFEAIKKRVDYFKDLENKKKQGELEKYTKKERAQIDKEIASLQLKFGGIRDLAQLPDAVFVADMRKDHLAIREAKAKGIKVVAICDTNTDPSVADYFIPGNDDAISSVKYILDKIKEVVLKAKPKTK